jgi:hypothetical protein
VPKGHAGDQALAALAASIDWRHVRLGPGFVDKHQAADIETAALVDPIAPLCLNIGTVEFRGRQRLFLRVICSR